MWRRPRVLGSREFLFSSRMKQLQSYSSGAAISRMVVQRGQRAKAVEVALKTSTRNARTQSSGFAFALEAEIKEKIDLEDLDGVGFDAVGKT